MTQIVLELSDESAKALRELARQRKTTPEALLVEAVDDLTRAQPQTRRRTFRMAASGRGDGRSVADIPDEELMAGFGER